MKKTRIIIDGEVEINLTVSFSTSTIPCRNSIINFTDDVTNETYKVKVIEVEHFINYIAGTKPSGDCTHATTKYSYVLHCETI